MDISDVNDDHRVKDKDVTGSWYTVNLNMLPCKVVSFFNYGRIGCLLQFQVLFFVSIGLNTAQAGFICGIQLVGGLLGGPFWGYITDKSLKHGFVAQFLCVVSTISMFLIPGAVWLFGDQNNDTFSHENQNLSITNITAGGAKNGNSNMFYVILTITAVGCFFHEAIEAMSTSGIVHAIRENPTNKDFGRQMFTAPIGFALMGFISGVFIEYFPKCHVTKYTAMYIVYAVSVFGLMVGFHFIFKGKTIKRTDSQNSLNMVNTTLRKTLMKGKTWIFFILVLMNGIVCGIFFCFSFLFLSEMKASHSLLGASMLINGLSACLFYTLSQKLTNLIGGPIFGIMLSFFTWTIRSLALSLIKNPKFILLINLSNGLTNSVFVCSYMEYIKDRFPKPIYTSVCGIVVMLYNGGGGVIAYILGGKLYLEFGGNNLFIASSILSGCLTVITLLYASLDKYQNRKVIPNNIIDNNAVQSA